MQNLLSIIFKLVVAALFIGALVVLYPIVYKAVVGGGSTSFIRGQLEEIPVRAKIIYFASPTEGYQGLCSEQDVAGYIKESERISGTRAYCQDAVEEWVVAVPLRDEEGVWCVDSKGASLAVPFSKKKFNGATPFSAGNINCS